MRILPAVRREATRSMPFFDDIHHAAKQTKPKREEGGRSFGEDHARWFVVG